MMLPQSLSSVNKIAINYTLDGVAKSVVYYMPSTSWSIGQSINYQLTLPTLLSAGTNCYILNPGTNSNRYFFLPVSRVNEYWNNSTLGNNGSYVIGSSDTWKVVILWEDAANLVNLYNVTGTGPAALATISIPVNASGNAVVGIMKTSGSGTNTILWSWHLWVTGYVPNTTTVNYNGRVWMDRNLGAMTNGTSSTAYGLYYQWGRKDPFPLGVVTGTIAGTGNFLNTSSQATIATTITTPTTYYSGSPDWNSSPDNYLWNKTDGTKTVYDPCPDGWRVPPASNYFGGTFSDNTLSGIRHYIDGSFYLVGSYGLWWCGAINSTYAYALYNDGTVPNCYRAGGVSVRCVKN
jgi:hypothetical protein